MRTQKPLLSGPPVVTCQAPGATPTWKLLYSDSGSPLRITTGKSFLQAAPNWGATLLQISLCALGLHLQGQGVGTGCRSPTETNRMQ